MGYDYFHVIYATASALILAMAFVYWTVDDQTVKNMVLTQGFLSLGLILSVIFFRSRLVPATETKKND